MLKNFSFNYPVLKNLTSFQHFSSDSTIQEINLQVKGLVWITKASILNNISNKYTFAISEILFNNENVSSSREVLNMSEDINAACLNHFEKIFHKGSNEELKYDSPPRIFSALAKVITLQLRRKIR